MSSLKIFLNAFAGHLKRCGGPNVARRPLIAQPCTSLCFRTALTLFFFGHLKKVVCYWKKTWLLSKVTDSLQTRKRGSGLWTKLQCSKRKQCKLLLENIVTLLNRYKTSLLVSKQLLGIFSVAQLSISVFSIKFIRKSQTYLTVAVHLRVWSRESHGGESFRMNVCDLYIIHKWYISRVFKIKIGW